jgi:hypothetical protein
VTRAVNAADRRRDRFALAIVGVGMFIYVASFVGMRKLANVPIIPDPSHPAIGRFTNLWYLSKARIGLVLAGGVAMAWSFWRYYARAPEAS